MKSIERIDVEGKRVIVRIDTNVPFDEKTKEIIDDYRLRSHLPTLHMLLEGGARVVLMGHLGRPEGKVDESLRLRPIYFHLSKLLKKPIKYSPNLLSEASFKATEELGNSEVLGIENVRFDPNEEKNSRTFAKKLSEYGDIYVNDALSVSHREHASVDAITEFLPHYAGLLLEKEYHMLVSMLAHPAKPLMVVIGGAKAEDKLPVIKNMISRADYILTGGGVANTFLAALGNDMKKSIVSKDVLDKAKEIYNASRGKILLPENFVWDDDMAMDLGEKTIIRYLDLLKKAKTIFVSGPLGKIEEPKYAVATEMLLKKISHMPATTVVCGGDTVEVVSRLKIQKEISFISNGGSATLELLAGKKLPGIAALNR